MKTYFNKFLNIIFPARCIACGGMVVDIGKICSDCWQEIDFISQQCCKKCGIAFEYDVGIGTICLSCETKQVAYSRATFLFKYNDVSKKILHKFKYYDHTYLAKYLASAALRVIKHDFPNCELIVPVPLHRRRLMSRLYNQSALISKELAKLMHIDFGSNILLKVKHTAPQTALTKSQRETNVKGSFIINPLQEYLFINKNVLLVDDVMTTGSTINECSKVLKAAGCKEVFVFTLARRI
ncbi:MAG: ComF family protein [Alphaproteobacteria bacterium]|jgi:ComF family protein